MVTLCRDVCPQRLGDTQCRGPDLRAAQRLQQPLEKVLLDAVATALPLLDDLPPEMVDDIAALALLNDAALWRAARSTLSTSSQKQMDVLLDKKGQGNLTPAEQQKLDRLLAEYERSVLIRSQAALLLKQRAYDISDPTILNEPSEIQ